MHVVLLIILALGAVGTLALWQRQRTLKREAHIRSFTLPRGLYEKLRLKHPRLGPKDCQLVGQALRQFFLAHLKSGGQFVSMPSQVVDDLWHEFILYTRNYEVFCRQAFGGFMHHTPAVVLKGGARQSNAGLRRCFWFSCKDENIDPRKPSRLPLLFAIDAKLAIAGGFLYAADCQALRETPREGDGGDGGVVVATYCGGDFSSPSFDGGTDGFGHGGGGAGDSDGGGSDGGGGDGGGGCGGGGE